MGLGLGPFLGILGDFEECLFFLLSLLALNAPLTDKIAIQDKIGDRMMSRCTFQNWVKSS